MEYKTLHHFLHSPTDSLTDKEETALTIIKRYYDMQQVHSWLTELIDSTNEPELITLRAELDTLMLKFYQLLHQ